MHVNYARAAMFLPLQLGHPIELSAESTNVCMSCFHGDYLFTIIIIIIRNIIIRIIMTHTFISKEILIITRGNELLLCKTAPNKIYSIVVLGHAGILTIIILLYILNKIKKRRCLLPTNVVYKSQLRHRIYSIN